RTHRGQDLLEGLLHMLRLLHFVLGVARVEPQHGNTILVHYIGIDLAIIVNAGDRLAAAGHSHVGAKKIPVVLLQRGAIAAGLFLFALYLKIAVQIFDAPAEPIKGLTESAAELDMISPGEIQLLIVQPPRSVDMHAADT